jgi:hypothetical protein
VVTGVLLGPLLGRSPDPGEWDAGTSWFDRLLRWDSGWYFKIIQQGYGHSIDPSVQNPTAFYPGYPLVSLAVKTLFGLDSFMAMLVVANIASLLAVLFFAKLVRDETDEPTALLALAFFCFFPYSLFLSAGYSESLYLVFGLSSLVLLARSRFLPAAILAGLSTATRPTGIVLLPVILWQMARLDDRPWRRRLPWMALCGVLAASGLLLFMAFLGYSLGRPLAVITSQDAWNGGNVAVRLLSAMTLHSLLHSNFLRAGLFLGFLALTLWSFRRLRSALPLYGLGTLLLPYLTVSHASSIGRYALMCLPAFIMAALLCKGRPILAGMVLFLSAGFLVLATALFSQWYWIE